ncbi:MAG TPA: DMP19 family protein [Terriglobales bacterium]|jgi:hypothetical protein|nr:DMP19 family protein [Terriglobales bacterium]
MTERVKVKHTKTDPFYLLYNSLIERVHHSPGGFGGLSEPEKLYYAVALLRNEVYNGGFDQYFFNSSGSYYNHAEKGLLEIGAIQTLELLRQAKDIIFPAVSVPEDTQTRRELLSTIESDTPSPESSSKLDELDQRFYANSDNLTPRLEAFAREQGLIKADS